MLGVRRTVAGAGVLAVIVAAGGVLVARAGTWDGPAQDVSTRTRVVSLMTGERVRVSALGGRSVVDLEPAPGGTAGRTAGVRVMSVADHDYVVPDAALPYLGRELDLSLFDVAQPAQQLVVAWSGSARHDIPGLDLRAGTGSTSIAELRAPAVFGAALRAQHRSARTEQTAGGAGPLSGVRQIRAVRAGADGSTVAPMYQMATLTVRGIDTTGASAFSGSVAVDNVDDLQRFAGMQSFAAGGEVSFSVPIGNYSIATEIATVGADGAIISQALLFLPEMEVTAPATTVELDARTATTRVNIPTTPRASTVEQFAATYGRQSATGLNASISYLSVGTQPEVYVRPTPVVRLGEVHWYTYFRMNGPADQADPYLYDLEFPVEAAVPNEFPTSVTAADLATVTVDYHSDIADHGIRTFRPSIAPWELAPMRFSSSAVAPVRRTEYVSALSDVRWTTAVVWDPVGNVGVDLGPWTLLRAAEERDEASLAAPLVPGVESGTSGTSPCGACRQGNDLWLNLWAWSAGGRMVTGLSSTGTLTASTAARLYADGTLVASADTPSGTVALPAGDVGLRLELDATKSAPWTTTSTLTKTVWAFRSQPRSGTLPAERTCKDSTHACVFEPLLFLEYDLGVSLTNSVDAGVPLTIGVLARHQPFDTTDPASTLTVDVSADDGATWSPATVTSAGAGQFTATAQAAASGFLSLRVHAADPAGNTIDQTVTRAVQVSG